MKARTQIIIGSVGIIAVSVFLFCLVVAVAGATIRRSGAWGLLAPNSAVPLVTLLVPLILASTCGTALIRGNLRLAVGTYRLWWLIVVGICAVRAFLFAFEYFYLPSANTSVDALESLIEYVIVLGLPTFFQWIGLRGLERKVEVQDDQRIKEIADEYRQRRASP